MLEFKYLKKEIRILPQFKVEQQKDLIKTGSLKLSLSLFMESINTNTI